MRAQLLKHIALLILFSAGTGGGVAAQTPEQAGGDIEAALKPGMTVWLTDSTGREEKTRIIGVSGDTVITGIGDDVRRLPAGDVLRVRARKSDPVVNGALIGAGAAVASGLFLCNLTEPWSNCLDDAGPMFRIGALGAGIGIGIDALIRGRRTIYERSQGLRLHAAPMVARHAKGFQLSIGF
jgi:hypothetical protein